MWVTDISSYIITSLFYGIFLKNCFVFKYFCLFQKTTFCDCVSFSFFLLSNKSQSFLQGGFNFLIYHSLVSLYVDKLTHIYLYIGKKSLTSFLLQSFLFDILLASLPSPPSFYPFHCLLLNLHISWSIVLRTQYVYVFFHLFSSCLSSHALIYAQSHKKYVHLYIHISI